MWKCSLVHIVRYAGCGSGVNNWLNLPIVSSTGTCVAKNNSLKPTNNFQQIVLIYGEDGTFFTFL